MHTKPVDSVELRERIFRGVVETKYILECTIDGFKLKLHYPGGVGFKIGDMFPYDPSDSTLGRCPKCLRHSMKVVWVPEPPPPPKPQGFDKVPEK
jgi:hypothetical protein